MQMFSSSNRTSKTEKRVLDIGTITAGTLGIVIAFLLTPQLYGGTVGWMAGYADEAYVEGLGGMIRVIWAPIVALFCFTFCTLSITTGTRAAILWVFGAVSSRR